MRPSGAQYEIRFDEQRVCVVGVGGGLRTYTVRGRDVLDGFGQQEMCRSGCGQILAPWPNRILGGQYEFEGETFQLPLTEPAAGNAIHGLVRWAPWDLLRRSDSFVALRHRLYPQPGYPFALELEVNYDLGESGLSVTLGAVNVGDGACPCGLGQHPYLCGSPMVDDLVLHVPAASPPDFSDPRRVGDRRLDTTYSQFERDGDGLVHVRVGDTVFWFDESFRYLRLYTGDDRPDVARHSLAVEPMTCPPNAFRTGESLVTLLRGQRFEARWGIQPGNPGTR